MKMPIPDDSNPVRMTCPNCGQDVELPANDAWRGLNCPSCSKFIPPIPEQPAMPVPAEKVAGVRKTSGEQDLAVRIGRIRAWAKTFQFSSLLALVPAGIYLVMGIQTAAAAGSSGGDFIICSSFISIAIWLFLIAQIIHIRANTER